MSDAEHSTPSEGPGAESTLTSCVLTFGEGDRAGRIALLVPASALEASAPAVANRKPDARVAAALEGVPLEVAAELGRVQMSLAALTQLRVGDVLRLPLPVSTSATVRGAAPGGA